MTFKKTQNKIQSMENLPSLSWNFIEVSNVLTRCLHRSVECHLTLLTCKIHLNKSIKNK